MRDWTVFKRNPHVLCFIVSVVSLLAAFFNLHSAQLSEDYIQTIGEISDMEEHRRLVQGRYRTEYDFDVTWEMDGQTYKKRFEGQLSAGEEGPVDIWVSPDHTKVHFSSAEGIRKEAPGEITVGVIAGILGIVLWKKKNRRRKYVSKAERMDQLENLQIGSGIGFFAFLTGAGFIGYDMYKEHQTMRAFEPLTVDLMLVAAAGMLICIGIFVYATRKSKQ